VPRKNKKVILVCRNVKRRICEGDADQGIESPQGKNKWESAKRGGVYSFTGEEERTRGLEMKKAGQSGCGKQESEEVGSFSESANHPKSVRAGSKTPPRGNQRRSCLLGNVLQGERNGR